MPPPCPLFRDVGPGQLEHDDHGSQAIVGDDHGDVVTGAGIQ
jgi:hypothetical protein